MATRCTIKVEGLTFAKVYKHWDGYPEGTLDWLEEFNSEFTKGRGFNDSSYKLAQLLRSSVRVADVFSLDESKFTGWGVVPFDNDCGEDYEYLLRTDGSVEVNTY